MSSRNRFPTLLAALLATPAAAGTVAITGGTVHPISAPAIEDGVVVVDGETIAAVGRRGQLEIPAGAERVDATGKHVWPGLVDCRTSLGLVEIGAVRGSVDNREAGAMNPGVRAAVAINASSWHLPVTRANGTLLAATLPGGSLVAGQAAAIALDGWTWEEMVRRDPLALVLQWPSMRPRRPREVEKGEEKKKKSERPPWEERIARLDEMIAEARAYAAARQRAEPREGDARWAALEPVIEGEIPVWIQATSVAQIHAALDWTQRQGLDMVLVDGGDGWRLADELAARDIPVIVRTNRKPARRWEPYDTPFAAPARLAAAGVRVRFGSWSSAHARNLPQEVARAVAYGLPRQAAERGLTLGGAELLGIADYYGSLEPGKSATLIVVRGDLLETRMHVERAWLDGRAVDLESRHVRLWRRWRSRPRP